MSYDPDTAHVDRAEIKLSRLLVSVTTRSGMRFIGVKILDSHLTILLRFSDNHSAPKEIPVFA